MRTYLSSGITIELCCDGTARRFEIDRTIGDGANCIAYEAHRIEAGGIIRNYRIKECYPYEARIVRSGIQLIWESGTERMAAFARLRKAHETIVELRNEETVGNHITAAELYEGNGTLYSVMEVNHAKTYDKDEEQDLCCILETMRVLTEVVGRLHEKGYLHLDMKPGNFLVAHRPNTNVWLFDVDSLTSIKELQEGAVTAASFSQHWAAPEQLRGRTELFCPATDLYAIGAILFEKVMGRAVSNEDTGLFAQWEFEGGLFEGVNPKVIRHLREIFQKTLSAAVKRRYQKAEELYKDLEAAIADSKTPYLLSDHPDSCGNFIGRKPELDSIAEAFSNGRLVCIKGLGGIGKSELAKRYAEFHEAEYDAVLFLHFSNTVEELFGDIEIQNFEGSAKEKEKQLKILLNERVLLIIDGLDSEDAAGFERLGRLKCDILMTSRLDWKEYDIHTIELRELSQTDQLALFQREYGDEMTAIQKRTAAEILSLVEGYTLLIPLIAKQLRKGSSDFHEALNVLRFAGMNAAFEGKVRHLKDGMPLSGTVYGVLTKVLNMADLSSREEYMMRSLALLSRYRMDQNEFLSWVGKEYLDQIDDLVFSGWVNREKYNGRWTLSLHPVISELCTEELKPEISNCPGIRDRIWAFASDFARTYKNPMEKYLGGYAPAAVPSNVQHQFDAFVGLMTDILDRSDWENTEDSIFWIRTISKVANVLWGDCSGFEGFLEYFWDLAMEKSEKMAPHISEWALAMQAIALKDDDLDSALSYTRIVVAALDSVPNADETVFRACFQFYQYLCVDDLDWNEYWKKEGYEELSAYIEKLWKAIVEQEDIELQEHDVWVLSDGECSMTPDEAIKQAYKDYCWKISEEGIARAKSLQNPSAIDFDDFAGVAEQCADSVLNRLGIRVSVPMSHSDQEETLTKDEVKLTIRAAALEQQINAMLPCEVLSMKGLWVVMKPPILSEGEKQNLRRQLRQADPRLSHCEPSARGRKGFHFILSKMEAAFSYAYACVDDWEGYLFHKSNLLKYYRALINGKRFNQWFKSAGISDIRSGLPGADSLLNKYGEVLPSHQALDLISGIVSSMELYHSEEHLNMGSLFEVYELALKLAEKACDSAAIKHFKRRIQTTSSVFFSKREED